MKNQTSRNFTEMDIFHGRRPISRKMSRLWNRELSWSLSMNHCTFLVPIGCVV